jgi:hypothetical protein
MSDINLDFTVANNSINFTVQPNDITITPTDIQLSVYAGGAAFPGGANTELQYNVNGVTLGGIPSATYNGANLTLQVANTKITGGNNHYYLQTDGTGNLTWAVGTGNMQGNGTVAGANTQIQFNDGGASFGGNAGFTFDKVTGNVNIPGDLTVVGNISANNLNANANYANFAGTAFNVDGGNVAGQVANALISGTVYTNAQPNITSLGNLTSLSLQSNNIALGYTAGQTAQGVNGVAVGQGAGANAQGSFSVAIGLGAGGNSQLNDGIAIGRLAGSNTQGVTSVAVGAEAGRYSQSEGAVAVGWAAGIANQGNYSVAIGARAGDSNQANNSIILNATGSILDQTTANTFTVKPVRNVLTGNALYYNPTSGEITYDTIGTVLTAETVSNNAQPNITSVGILTSVSVSGNITTGNANLGNAATANFFIGTLYGNANTAGTVTTAAQPNITSVGGTLTQNLILNGNLQASRLVTTGNIWSNTGIIQGQYLKGDGSNITGIVGTGTSINNGNSNVNIPSVGGNITISSAGNADIVIVTGTGVNVAGTFNSGNITVGNIISNRVSANGNVTATRFISNIAIGNAPFIVTSTTQVANLNVANAGTAFNVSGNAQPNITSVGTLTSLSVSGNVSATGNVSASLFIGSGGALTSIPAANVSGQVSNALVASTVYTNAQPNITSANNLTSIGTLTDLRLSNANIHLGPNTASIGTQGANAIAIGSFAGANAQGAASVAIGDKAGNITQGINSVAIGREAGSQYQGNNSVAIGFAAGYTNQANNTIILNAVTAQLNSTQADSLFVKPIRNVSGNVDFTVTLKYNPTTGEIGYV